LLDQLGGLDIVSRFPRIVTFGVSHPLYKILQLFLPPVTLMITNGLNFVLLIITNEIRWWSGVVFAMFDRFDVWG